MKHTVAEEIRRSLPEAGRRVVFVCGLPGSGKTTFCQRFAAMADFAGPVLHTDWFIKESSAERRRRMAPEDPYSWYDWGGIRAGVERLRDIGRLAIDQAWNQTTGEKDLHVELKANPNDIIWCDGIRLLDSNISDLADVIILLETHAEAAQKRQDARDKHRNDAIYLEHKARLMLQYEVPYFERYRDRATVVIDNSNFNMPQITN